MRNLHNTARTIIALVIDKEELKPGLIIFRRSDVEHRMWYCRIKIPKADRYKTVSIKTSGIDVARERAFEHSSRPMRVPPSTNISHRQIEPSE